MVDGTDKPAQDKNAISPVEDLMREHGVLIRLLLIYENIKGRLAEEQSFDLTFLNPILYQTATIAQQFIEEYHQRLEETYLFPRFLSKKKYVNLVNTLQEQHNAARYLTGLIIQIASTQSIKHFHARIQLAEMLLSYIRMYNPHSAREDTALFPAFRMVISPEEFNELGEQFEEIEEEKFGKNGFQRIVAQVAELEQTLGIYDLSQFTP